VGREKATRAGALPLAFQFLAAWVGVWVARHQMDQIEYLRTVNRALMERAGKKRLWFTDAGRRQAARGSYRWCKPPTSVSPTTSPVSGDITALDAGASLLIDRCVRERW
jgi:hypothetical protein